LTGQQDKSERKAFIYFDDDGHLVALCFGDWKLVFAEQKTPGTLDIWGEPFTFRLNKAVSPTTGKLTGIGTVVVAGARIRVRFYWWQHNRRIADSESMAYK
jgi:hypothetical protein